MYSCHLFLISSASVRFTPFLSFIVSSAKSLQSCPTLCNPIDGSLPGFPVPGILLARTLEWVAISFSIIVYDFALNIPVVSLIFLKRSLVFPILLFSSISLHWLLRKAFLSLLATVWNSAFRCLYLSFPPLLFTYLLFTAICKASPDSHFAFLHFFSVGSRYVS